MNKFSFLSSPRFWQLFVAGVTVGIQVYQNTGDVLSAVAAALGSWFAGSVVVGTVDNIGNKRIIAEGVAKGTVNAEDVVRIPPQE